MGCASSKTDARTGPGNGDKAADSTQVTGAEKVRTFRERRLSMSQMQEQNQPRRRLSIYGSPLDENAQPSEVQSPCPSCGCRTLGGFEPVPGGSVAKINQDRGLAVYPFKDDKDNVYPNVGLFGVYDGHGRVGEKVSEFVLQNLPPYVSRELKNIPENKKKDQEPKDEGSVLANAYKFVDDELAKHVDATVSGTTAVTCLIENNHLWIANSGDSRAIVVRKSNNGGPFKSIDLTIDHKPDSPGEMKRILQMGGHVTPAGANGSPARVWHNLRGLAMARSIGDHAAATVGVIAEPEITEYDLVDDDVAIVIASDGVWELLGSQTVAEMFYNHQSKNVQEICDEIVEQSSYMWKVEEGDYRDDITVVVLTHPWLPADAAASG